MTTVLGLVLITAIGIAAGYRSYRTGRWSDSTPTSNAWSDSGSPNCGSDGGGGGGGDC
jgi:hypothetical protein